MPERCISLFDWKKFLPAIGSGKTFLKYQKKQIIFSQGDPADAVFVVLEGKVRLSVISEKGKEAVIATMGPGDFFGEACITGQVILLKTATSVEESEIVRIEKSTMSRVLHDDPVFSELFMAHLLSRNLQIEEALVDQLFNSSEKRLARLLLLMAHIGKESKLETVIPKISQEVLAQMIGTTRSRVSFFMNKFEKLGFIDKEGGLRIHSSLLNIILHD
ncbi:MAG TPA: Crp/Fnr family transcriptional regulator [Nitrospiria bacterium]|nr:Crp/Fnr family transcriptional regulator [Nitrospiria bacterium]